MAQKDYVLLAGLIALLKGRRHVHTTHCPWTDKFRPLSVRVPLFFAERFFNYLSFFFCDRIIAITPWEVPILKKWAPEKKVTVLHNGMDPVLFDKIVPNQYKKKNGLKRKHLVLFFGRLHPTKAPHILAQTAKEIACERDDIDFVFVGPDEGEMQRVKDIAAGTDCIHVLGSISGKQNIAEMYQAADMYVLPSYREGLPLTLFEAMASGLPVIATPVNGVPYEMHDGVNGYLVPHGDVPALRQRLLELLDDIALRKKMGAVNRAKVKSYTWDAIAADTLRLYQP